MSVITFASSKGGAGKTTSAIVLATTLARTVSVVVIDADPAKRLTSWAKKAKLPERLQVMQSQGEQHIHEEIERAAEQAAFVILDLEGAATRLNAYAMGESDLVIIPMGDEQPDAEGAIETMAQLMLESKSMRREIPARILFNRTQAAVKSRLARSLNAQVRDKIGSFETELHTRTAFSSLHSLGGTLYQMKPTEVSGVNRAIANAELFAEELLRTLAWIQELHMKATKPDWRKNNVKQA
jgi:chromosome partitioning protein